MRIPRNKLLKVYWHDHTSEAEWASTADIKKSALKWYNELCSSVGKCILNEKKYIVVAGESDGAKGHGNYTMIIKSAIEKIEIL